MGTSIEKKIKTIISSWFFTHPLLYSVYCTHSLVENNNLQIPMRSGKGRIEYSSQLLEKATDSILEKYLKVELYRIVLMHPYSRQPVNAMKNILLLASDVTIYQNCKKEFFAQEKSQTAFCLNGVEYLKSLAARFANAENPLGEKWNGTEELQFFLKNLVIAPRTGELMLIDKLTFEQWYKKILFLIKETSIGGEQAGTNSAFTQAGNQASELWEENQEIQAELENQIQKADSEEGWGGLGGDLKRQIKEQGDFSFDYRRALTQFRQSIVSANRSLTRMRPSRRYGFKAMGSRYDRKANVLIAVDVSGSITDESFGNFYHAIRNFFFLGLIEKIDLIFFDVNLKNTKPIPFTKNINLNQIKGRGGTNFQSPLDFFSLHSSEYSGLIIFTDGEGEVPKLECHKKNILWILDSRLSYEKSRNWIDSLPGCKSTYLPF